MKVNWDIVIKIFVPLLTLVMGRFLDRWFTNKPKLISYLGHVSAFTLSNEDHTQVFTHAIVVSNAGRKPANNVRIGHHVLPPNYQLIPSVSHTVEQIQTGGTEIVIPTLVPNEQVTISYLYFPPLTWDRINAYTKSDEGFAKILKVIPTPQLSRWIAMLVWTLVFIGVVTVVYFIITGIMSLANRG